MKSSRELVNGQLILWHQIMRLLVAQNETGDLIRQAIYVRPEEEKYVNLTTRRILDARSSINMTVYTTGSLL